jgi:hypothetical protein
LNRTSSTLAILVSTFFIIAVFVGLGIAIILSLIPSYLTTRNITPAAETYCIANLRLNITFNTTTPYGNFNLTSANTSYQLSEACYRILQNYYSDRLLAACLISNCSLTTYVPASTTINNTNISCSAVIYYSSRCPDEAPSTGLYLYANASTNSACRTKRMTNINSALGSTSVVQFTNVVSLTFGGVVVPMQSVYSYPFSYYSQSGAYYCGVINGTAITTAVYSQATG